MFEPLWIAISTYSIFPAPHPNWDERNMRRALLYLPAVGLLIGGVLLLWIAICRALRVDSVLFAATSAALSLLLTGGMHMDGFMDTVDAIGSRQPRERKLEIMKDSHCGAFAVLYCGIYLLVSFGLYHALYLSAALPAICIGFVLSRALAVVCALTMPNARGGGLLFTFSENSRGAGAIAVMCVISLLCLCGMAVVSKTAGIAAFSAALIALLIYRHTAMRQFGGATGDTTGFFIQLCELCMLIGAFAGGLL